MLLRCESLEPPMSFGAVGTAVECQDWTHAVQQKARQREEGAVTSASDPRYCLSACAFSAVNSASLRKVITATLRVR